jgi:hypothetical protein
LIADHWLIEPLIETGYLKTRLDRGMLEDLARMLADRRKFEIVDRSKG